MMFGTLPSTTTLTVSMPITPADIAIFFVSVIAAFAVSYNLSRSHARMPRYLTILLTVSILAIRLCFVLFSFYPPDLGIFKAPA